MISPCFWNVKKTYLSFINLIMTNALYKWFKTLLVGRANISLCYSNEQCFHHNKQCFSKHKLSFANKQFKIMINFMDAITMQ